MYTICIWIFNFLMRATAFFSTNRPSVMYLESRGLGLRLHAAPVRSSPVSVSSHYSQQAANIDLEWKDWPWRGAQIDPNVVDVLLISCWASSDSLREKESSRLWISSLWQRRLKIFVILNTHIRRFWYFSLTYDASFGSWGPIHSSNTLNTQGEHKIKHRQNKRLEKIQTVLAALFLIW